MCARENNLPGVSEHHASFGAVGPLRLYPGLSQVFSLRKVMAVGLKKKAELLFLYFPEYFGLR